MLRLKDGQITTMASIKGQCAKNKFYGSTEMESLLSRLESTHAPVLRWLLTAGAHEISTMDFSRRVLIQEAILLQRARTTFELEKHAAVEKAILTHMFRAQLEAESNKRVARLAIAQLDAGKVGIEPEREKLILLQIQLMLDQTASISDLELRVIRNNTSYPFVFSDSPVVFYNAYCRRVKDSGVLGLLCQGLLIFFPISPAVQVMLFDRSVYSGKCVQEHVINLDSRADVSHLNALQFHHSQNAIYFANSSAAEYVQDLYRAHRPKYSGQTGRFKVRRDLKVKGETQAGNGEILHSFEAQVNHDLSLSFLECNPIDPREFEFHPRNPELAEKLKALFIAKEKRKGAEQKSKSILSRRRSSHKAKARASCTKTSTAPPCKVPNANFQTSEVVAEMEEILDTDTDKSLGRITAGDTSWSY